MSSKAGRREEGRSRTKNILSGLMLTAVTLSLVLVVAEIATRLFSDIVPPLKAKNETIAYMVDPNPLHVNFV